MLLDWFVYMYVALSDLCTPRLVIPRAMIFIVECPQVSEQNVHYQRSEFGWARASDTVSAPNNTHVVSGAWCSHGGVALRVAHGVKLKAQEYNLRV